MTNMHFTAEKKYQISLSIAKRMLEKNVITPEEFDIIDRFLLDKYKPLLGTLHSHNHLTL